LQEDIPQPTNEDVEWSYLLWNSMTIGGLWTLPNVGVYERTGERELTLIEIHFSKPLPNTITSPFDQHHWIMVLADMINWKIEEKVKRAYDHELLINIPDELIGDVSICKSKCGAMFRVEPLAAGTKYSLIDELATCPCCGKEGSVEDELKGIHVVVDDAGWLLKESRLQLKKIIEEEE